ncbi:hypothetical protein OKW21_004074 [Catalinimonas alkaloidigena]|uniref:OprD family outer membrane porin n=1 Tax=Catalinimonas alkaloidigena TaxID=1075417 RepID=UPI0024072399|nr:OprD family outer membrane porin [Catalinimonas alkaloidigena]MDF9798811.1 hypothetical protein [Catalinimonas alkaloidigena]
MRLIALFIWILFQWCNHVVIAQDSLKNSSGEFSGQWRTFYLNTFNKGELKDYYALATGGKLKYVYSLEEHFKFGAAAYTSFSLGIQDLSVPDATTGKYSRYESGLFNVQDMGDRLVFIAGELFVQYENQRHKLILGRFKLATPFINPEDGRMIPTLSQGVLYTHTKKQKYRFQLGVLNAIAPRSSDGFFKIGESIGKYPVGRTLAGTACQYAGNTQSDYIAITGLNVSLTDFIKAEAWNYYVDNIFNTTYLKPAIDLHEKDIRLSLEWIHQEMVGKGGNETDSLRYFEDQRSNVLGTQLEMKFSKTRFSLGYDHILEGGRFFVSTGVGA